MYRFLFRLIPWWLWALCTMGFALVAMQIVSAQWDRYNSLEQAKTAPAPSVTEAREFDRRADVTRSGEVAVAGLVQITPEPKFVEAAGSDLSYLIFMSRDARKAFVAYSASNQSDTLIAQIEAAQDTEGYSVLRGFLQGPDSQSALRQAALDQLRQFDLAARDITVIDPYRGTRAEGLRHEQGAAMFIGAFVLVMQALLLLVMFWKLRDRKRRRAQRRAERDSRRAPRRRPAQMVGPWGAANEPSASSEPKRSAPLRRVGRTRARIGDGFDESPIQSTKRWSLF